MRRRLILTVSMFVLLLSFPSTSRALESAFTSDFSLDKTTVSVGETVTATWEPSGGTPPYSINSYYWMVKEDGLENPIVEQAGSQTSENSLSFIPTKGNELQLQLNLQDSGNRVIHHSFEWIPITGAQPATPLTCSVTIDREQVAVGETITATWQLKGGSPPYSVNSYYWMVREDGLENSFVEEAGSNVSADSLSLIPKKGNELQLQLNLEDSERRVVHYSSEWIPITGAQAVAPLTATVVLDKARVAFGETITATWKLQGGSPPYSIDSYYWMVKEAGLEQSYVEDAGSNLSTDQLTFTPLKGDELQLQVNLQDSGNRVVHYSSDWIPLFDSNNPGFVAGDASGNKLVDIDDVVMIINYIVSGAQPTSPIGANADGLGGVDIKDLEWIIDRVLSN